MNIDWILITNVQKGDLHLSLFPSFFFLFSCYVMQIFTLHSSLELTNSNFTVLKDLFFKFFSDFFSCSMSSLCLSKPRCIFLRKNFRLFKVEVSLAIFLLNRKLLWNSTSQLFYVSKKKQWGALRLFIANFFATQNIGGAK